MMSGAWVPLGSSEGAGSLCSLLSDQKSWREAIKTGINQVADRCTKYTVLLLEYMRAACLNCILGSLGSKNSSNSKHAL